MSLTPYNRRTGMFAAGQLARIAYQNRRQLFNTGRTVARGISNLVNRARGAEARRSLYRKRRLSSRSGRSSGTTYGKVRERLNKKSYRRRSKKFRRRRKKRFSAQKWMWNQLCTPQVLKTTAAYTKGSDGNGVRTWSMQMVASKGDLSSMHSRRPDTLFESGGTAFGKPHKLVVTNCMKKYIIQNRSNWDMHLKIYECIARNDISSSAIPANDSGILGLFRGDDTTGYNKGPSAPTFAGGTDKLSYVDQNPSYTPYMSSSFCSNFKILKTHSFQIGPNDYITKTFTQRRRKFDTGRLFPSTGNTTAEFIGKWTKVMLFTWVGGPIDTGLITDNKQSKSKNDLFIQYDVDFRFHFEPASTLQYTVGSSNQTPFGVNTTNYYKTDSAGTTWAVPATETVQTVAGTAAGGQPDDNVQEDDP